MKPLRPIMYCNGIPIYPSIYGNLTFIVWNGERKYFQSLDESINFIFKNKEEE